MNTTPESLKQHDYSKKLRKLMRKGAQIKKKSRELSVKLEATIKRCNELLRPRQEKEL